MSTIADFVLEMKKAIDAEFDKEYQDTFNVSFAHHGNDGAYEVFYLTAELDYDDMSRITELLDPIAQELDEDAYFDMEDTGRAVVFISQDRFEELER